MRALQIRNVITRRDGEAVAKYFNEVNKIPLLTKEEEVEYATRLWEDTTDTEAREKLIVSNLRFVVSVANQYTNFPGTRLSDLIEDGNVGLIKATQRFDPTRGFKFISYAVWWIRQAIEEGMNDSMRVVKLPLNVIGLQNKIRKAISKFQQYEEYEPTPEDLAAILDESRHRILNAQEHSIKATSLDAPVAEEANLVYGDLLKSDYGTEEFKEDMTERLLEVLKATFPERDVRVMVKFFGIGTTPETLEEIGEEMNLTRERVRQIKEKCIKRIKRSSYLKRAFARILMEHY